MFNQVAFITQCKFQELTKLSWPINYQQSFVKLYLGFYSV
ncbi:hypothetical protein pb186bvf_009996 [Paramecium bursaria]